MSAMTRTVRLKVKANAYPWLNAAAVEVNQVWNHCNALFRDATKPFVDDYGTLIFPKRLTGFDLCYRTAGTTRYMDHIGSATILRVCIEYGVKIKAAFPRQRLRWRVSRGARRSLGWVPFRALSVKRKGAGIRFCGKQFRVFERELLDGVKFRDGCFAQDACGDWWLCLPVDVVSETVPAAQEAVGVDLGCKDAAVTSDGDRLSSGHYRRLEAKIGQAQRRGHKRQAKRLNRKAKRQRQDAQHKFSRMLVDRYQQIFIGDVSSTKLVKTRMAKSVLDAGWYQLKTQLQHKGQQAGRRVEVVDESYSTRACSSCGALTGPTGLDMLAVRHWSCSECGDAHDRDVNAARNILAGARHQPSVCGNAPARRGMRTGGKGRQVLL